jgi:phosphoribosylaminoimidazole-succinocarboxamide synthase
MPGKPMLKSSFKDLKLIRSGKVRDLYEIEDKLLLVATDRMSAFDVVMDDPIPDKGRVLNSLSLFWFEKLKIIVKNHIISTNPEEYPEPCPAYKDELDKRSMLVRKTEPLPVECIVRGYLSGSGWAEYQQKGSICGIPLPSGLKESEQLPEPIFTPSTKAEQGLHDENISMEKVKELIGPEKAKKIKEISLKIYSYGRELAAEKGIIIADTKFEFGADNGDIILIDEVLTPDSSRFWPMDTYAPGGPQRSFDKQYLRDYLNSLDWPKTPPPPKLPADIINKTREKYLEALERITGEKL